MFSPNDRRGLRCVLAAAGLLLLAEPRTVLGQEPVTGSAMTPAGAVSAVPPSEATIARAAANARVKVTEKQAREADDAYIAGARHVEHNDLLAAVKSFTRAVELNPRKQEYVLALAVVREHTLTGLVQDAAKARLLGDSTKADALLAQARALDPENSIIAQHALDLEQAPKRIDAARIPGSGIAPSLGGPIELVPDAGVRGIHTRGGTQELVRSVYAAYGIKVTFDPSVSGGAPGKLDLDDVDFATASRIVNQMTHVFPIPVQAKTALIAKDEQRDQLMPQVEENIYLPGMSGDQMNDLAKLARDVFELKSVTASPATGALLVRGSEGTLKLLNATYADMLDGGSDVLLDVRLYEIDKTHTRTIGTQLPSSVGAFSVAAEAQQLVSANQTLIDQAIANGVTFTGTPAQILIEEAAFLISSGAVNAAQFTNLLGIFGGGLSLAGVYLGSNASFNALLNSSDVRTLDAIQIRAGNTQPTNFRAGSRYPVITSTYSSGISSALSSQLAGLNVNGTSVSSLLSRYLGTNSSVSIPQIQYEDLGVTLKVTPHIQRDRGVSMVLDLKVEALAGGSINNVPILNNRQITSTITIPSGQTALLVSQVSQNESKAIQGLPYLSELPGFQGTYRSDEKDSGELLITITPHIVRAQPLRITSRRLSFAPAQGSQGGSSE